MIRLVVLVVVRRVLKELFLVKMFIMVLIGGMRIFLIWWIILLDVILLGYVICVFFIVSVCCKNKEIK